MTTTIEDMYRSFAGEDETSRHRARENAALVKPWVAPYTGHSDQVDRAQSYTSFTTAAETALEGKFMLGMFSPQEPWLAYNGPPEIMHSQDVDSAVKEQITRGLISREIVVQSLVEGATSDRNGAASALGFHARVRQAIAQLVITGDVLVKQSGDFTISMFRRDNYVTRRRADSVPVLYATQDRVDLAGLDDATLDKIGKSRGDVDRMSFRDRYIDAFTMVDWNPHSKVWVITEEIDGKTIGVTQSEVCPYMGVSYELGVAENYGRGVIDQNRGNVITLDALARAIKETAAAAAKNHPIIDPNQKTLLPSHLMQETGTPLFSRVIGGQPQDIGMLSLVSLPGYEVTLRAFESVKLELARAMLYDSASIPAKERTTATQVRAITEELGSSNAAAFAAIPDQFHRPLAEHTEALAIRKKILKKIEYEAGGKTRTIRPTIITGFAAIGRQLKLQNIVTLAGLVSQLGEEAAKELNQAALISVIMRYSGVREPGILKTEEDKRRETQSALAAQAAAALGDAAAGGFGQAIGGAVGGAVAGNLGVPA